jgi:hypothetical protein
METARSEATDVEVAERLVRDGEARVSRQREVITRLHCSGYTGKRPERLLAVFEASLAADRERLANLRGATGPN